MTHPIILRRRAEQKEKIELAGDYIRAVARRLEVEQAWVVGSVARGDFNVWSDIDVVVIARQLPGDLLPRADLFVDKPAGLQVVAYTPGEFEKELAKKNPLAIEATSVGVAVGDEPGSSRNRAADA
jgi:predicted nucleotidyltransferase